MARRTQATNPWWSRYERDRQALVRNRLQWSALLALAGSVLAGVAAFEGHRPLIFLLLYGGLSSAVGLATFLPLSLRRATPLALSYVVGITATLVVDAHQMPDAAPAVTLGLMAELLGVVILLPWGGPPQVGVSVAVVLGYASLATSSSVVGSVPVASIMLCAAGVAVVGAVLVDRYRAASFAHAWRQEQLAAFARALAEHVDAEKVGATVVEHAVKLLPAQLCTVALYDPAAATYRVSAVVEADPSEESSLLGFEVPADSPLVRGIVQQTLLVMPRDDPKSDLGRLLAALPGVEVLYVAMRHGAELVGILAFERRSGPPFAVLDAALAQGVADQAAVALRTAQLVADLRRADQLKSEFVSTVSHELRTPLNVILGYAEMVQDETLEARVRQQMAAGIEAAGRELLTLIESTLEIGRLDASRSQVHLQSVRFREWWATLADGCARMPRRPAVRLEWAADVPDLTLTTDPRKLTVAVRNLVGNALKFTERGAVRVEAVRAESHLVVRVTDTGIGIRPEDQAVIFEMFRQADGSDSRRFGGTGLGLYIVRRFVEQLGGVVTVKSEVGRGSCFTVVLPAYTEPGQARAA
jgi:signal transduction histidine kinase